MRKRLLCVVMIAAVLGMCLGMMQANPILHCPATAQMVQSSQSVSAHPLQLLPRMLPLSPQEGNEQEPQVRPQQQPSFSSSILSLEISNSQRSIGPTLRSRYQWILGSQTLRFIVSYIRCQGGIMSGTVTDTM